MRFRLTLITTISLLLIIAHLVLVFTGGETFARQRFLFLMLGMLGWFIGNKLIELEDRIADVEKPPTHKAEATPQDGGC